MDQAKPKNPQPPKEEKKRPQHTDEDTLDKETEEAIEFDVRSNTRGPSSEQSQEGAGIPDDEDEDDEDTDE